MGLNVNALNGCHTTNTSVLIATLQAAFACPAANMFRGMSTPLKKASSSSAGNTNNMRGSRGVIGESSQPNRNKPAPKPTDTAMIANAGTNAQAFNGT